MSQSSTNIENLEVRPRIGATQEEASTSGGMLILQATGPNEAKRAETVYQGIMAYLPTFIKKSIPPNLTDDELDGITSYFSIPHDKVDTRLALRGDQLYLPLIENNFAVHDLTPGYTLVYVEVFTYGMRLPLFSFVNNYLISINRALGQLTPIGGWLNVTIFEIICRICGVEPTVSLFSALFFISHTSFQTTFTTRRK
ncbi:hypothetical protein LIER_24298 [Lithospermum erythrorhizon]|uniref:Transposase (putative) gypsy type domain-containing protein n=1 Tax=Lithospermum erythrorhizon TaxID=34254 RepID=A0AAV3R230_LITER